MYLSSICILYFTGLLCQNLADRGLPDNKFFRKNCLKFTRLLIVIKNIYLYIHLLRELLTKILFFLNNNDL